MEKISLEEARQIALEVQRKNEKARKQDHIEEAAKITEGDVVSDLERINKRLDYLATLEENWDSYGAAAIEKEAVEKARLFLTDILENEPLIIGTVNGGISIECEGWMLTFGDDDDDDIVFFDEPWTGPEPPVRTMSEPLRKLRDEAIEEHRRGETEDFPGEGYDTMTRDELIQQLIERDASFDLRWKATMQGIEKWRETTRRELVWPDHGDLVVHLMERLAHAETVINEARVLGRRKLENEQLTDEQAEEFNIVLHVNQYDAEWNGDRRERLPHVGRVEE